MIAVLSRVPPPIDAPPQIGHSSTCMLFDFPGQTEPSEEAHGTCERASTRIPPYPGRRRSLGQPFSARRPARSHRASLPGPRLSQSRGLSLRCGRPGERRRRHSRPHSGALGCVSAAVGGGRGGRKGRAGSRTANRRRRRRTSAAVHASCHAGRANVPWSRRGDHRTDPRSGPLFRTCAGGARWSTSFGSEGTSRRA